ncbi:hypothetical protein [Jiulongibacter sp. NS-SX5]|uniref:hypothetical protein n=1 Tax=Jiulongibacter sp. NS-SX5 TaxID=3463854 RepID=UPI004058043C
MKTTLAAIAISITLFSCSSGDSSDNNIEEALENGIPKSEQDPCDYLSIAEIKATMNLSDTLSIDQNSSYGVCSFNWEVPSEKASQEASVQDILNAAKTGDMSSLAGSMTAGYYSVGLNFSTFVSKTEEDAKRGYEGIIKSLSGGITVSKEAIKEKMEEMGIDSEAADRHVDRDVTYKDDAHVEVTGIGDAASWSSKTKQLTVLSGTDIFFLTVRAGDDENSKETAKSLANVVIDNL